MQEYYIFHKFLNLATVLRIDPLGEFFHLPITAYLILQFIILLYALNKHYNSFSLKPASLFIAILANLLFVKTLDNSLLSLSYINLLILTLISSSILENKNSSHIKSKIILLFISAYILISNNFLSFFCLTLIFLKTLRQNDWRFKVFSSLSCFCSLFLLFKYSLLFDYPTNSNLTPFSPFMYAGSTGLGPENLPFTTYLPSYLTLRNTSILGLGLFSLILSALKLIKKELSELHIHIWASILFTILFLIDGKIGSTYLDIPIIRAIPGLNFIPIPLILYLTLCFPFLNTFRINSQYTAHSLILSSLALLAFTQTRLVDSPVFSIKKESFIDQLTNHSLDLNNTPSAFLISRYKGLREDLESNKLKEINFIDQCTLLSSVNNEESHLAIDNKLSTRWRTKRPQAEGDFLELTCKSTLSVQRIELKLGNYKSDFPRGISILADGEPIVSLSDWLGSVKKTPLGLLYFGPQSEVVLNLQNPISFKTISFQLTKPDNTFDWSVAEIKIFSSTTEK